MDPPGKTIAKTKGETRDISSCEEKAMSAKGSCQRRKGCNSSIGETETREKEVPPSRGAPSTVESGGFAFGGVGGKDQKRELGATRGERKGHPKGKQKVIPTHSISGKMGGPQG